LGAEATAGADAGGRCAIAGEVSAGGRVNSTIRCGATAGGTGGEFKAAAAASAAASVAVISAPPAGSANAEASRTAIRILFTGVGPGWPWDAPILRGQ
jgi:hypothetical protein